MNVYIDKRTGQRVFNVAPGEGDNGPEKLGVGADLVLNVFFVQKKSPVAADGQAWEPVHADAGDNANMAKFKRALVHYPADGSTPEELLGQPSPEIDPATDATLAVDVTFPFAMGAMSHSEVVPEGEPLTSLIGDNPGIPAVLELEFTEQGAGGVTRRLDIDCQILRSAIT